MGTDIHAVVQHKVKGKWVTYAEGYPHRRYDVFAVMANVRNGRGFAGCILNDGLKVISEPKGLPEDAGIELSEGENLHTVKVPATWRSFPGSFRHSYQEETKPRYWLGAHHHSWLTLAELLTINPEDVVKQRGTMTAEDFEKIGGWFLKNRVDPNVSYSGEVWGKEIITMEESDYLAHQQLGTLPVDKKIYVSTWWNESYGESLGLSFWLWLLQLTRDCQKFGCTTSDIRVVFGFDS